MINNRIADRRRVDKRPRKVPRTRAFTLLAAEEKESRWGLMPLKQAPIESLSTAPFSLIVKRNDHDKHENKSPEQGKLPS